MVIAEGVRLMPGVERGRVEGDRISEPGVVPMVEPGGVLLMVEPGVVLMVEPIVPRGPVVSEAPVVEPFVDPVFFLVLLA